MTSDKLLHTFHSDTLRIVCVSDTHGDNYLQSTPSGDIFVHAGDFTDDGTPDELEEAFTWISRLPHPVKIVVAGNHDVGLDPAHPSFSAPTLELYRSEKARASGIHYLDREVRTVALFSPRDGSGEQPIQVYGNPLQPDFLSSNYAFTYLPHPSPGSSAAWISAPSRADGIPIWVMHGPPKNRLDWIPIEGLQGCVAQEGAIARARPLLCIYGHYHISNGVERVTWMEKVDEVADVRLLTYGKSTKLDFDFSEPGGAVVEGEERLEAGKETVFVNAAWMRHEKRAVTERNTPFVMTLPVSGLGR